jgi:hypothetical protein
MEILQSCTKGAKTVLEPTSCLEAPAIRTEAADVCMKLLEKKGFVPVFVAWVQQVVVCLKMPVPPECAM